jgi:hypothetical protein
MGRLLNSTGVRVIMLLCLVCGAGLLILSLWLQPLAEGERAAAHGQLQRGLDRFTVATARFGRLPVMQQLLPGLHAAARTNRFRLLYRRGEYATLLEQTVDAAGSASARFWAGCALYQRAMQEPGADARRTWLDRAADEFHRALELAPGDWDTKFNYELTTRLLARFREKPEPPPNRLLRPRPREGERPSRPTG